MKLSKKEIGSEFWDIPILSDGAADFAPKDTAWFLSGRSALSAIISEVSAKSTVKTVALPSWCCDSMITPFKNAGIDARFYPVYIEGGKFVCDTSSADGCDVLFLMDYFGYTDNAEEVRDFSGTVIRDLTHSVFSKVYDDADYYFGSLRKWAGFLTGGFVWGVEDKKLPADEKYVNMRLSAMDAKCEHINGNSESKDYLKVFSEAEEYLDCCDLAGADERDVELAARLDVKFIKDRRRKNAQVLLNAFSDMAIFPELREDDCPLFVPIMVPQGKRDALRRHLIEREIYCPVHWPLSSYHNPDKRTIEIYDNELSLVCDQRYDENDMERIIRAIREF